MLPTGSISRVFEYYFTNLRYRADAKRALTEFLDGGTMWRQDGGMFNEWFIYDFVLAEGLTPLEHFIAKNPLSLSGTSLDIYRDLHENTYGLFEARDIERGKGMTLVDVKTKHPYSIEEVSASRSLKRGDLFFGRIGKVDQHHELVSADPVILRGSDATAAILVFRETTIRLTPKIAHQWLRERFEGHS